MEEGSSTWKEGGGEWEALMEVFVLCLPLLPSTNTHLGPTTPCSYIYYIVTTTHRWKEGTTLYSVPAFYYLHYSCAW